MRLNSQPKSESKKAIFDRSVLLHHSMNEQGLADEILGLFLQQLEKLVAKDWAKLDLNFEMHTLKGSAATVGAVELESLARNWREVGPALQNRIKLAVANFEAAAK